MRSLGAIALAVVMVASLSSAQVYAGAKQDFEETTTADGLQKTKVRGIDLVYVRPGAAFGSYSKVLIDNVSVAFSKNYNPQRTGSFAKLSTAELNGIRNDVAKIVQDAFTKELTKAGYALVDAPGPEVLEVHPEIVNLYVNAPDTMTAGRSRVYTTSSGEMTLILSLSDSETGAVLARAYDRTEGRQTQTFNLTSSVTNRADAEIAAAAWARILRERLDAARGVGKK